MKYFVIKKNRHSTSGIDLGLTFGNTIERDVIFDNSCLYELEGNDKYDINKLFGFSTSFYHHRQSARFGWRCLDMQHIELFTYVYDNDEFLSNKFINFISIKPFEKINLKIVDEKHYFRFDYSTETESGSISIQKSYQWFPFRYYLYPYFGGNKKAPHRIKISMNLK